MLNASLKGTILLPMLAMGAVGAMHMHYSPYMKPKRVQVNQDKHKNIVIVGAGVIGLTTAYLLAQNQRNKLTIIERN